MKNNIQLQNDVLAELLWDPPVDEKGIHVAATDGIATLSGSVATYAEKFAAARAVANLAGVREVTNNITISAKRVSSFDVSRSIKEAVERRADRTADRINVETTDGVVTLTGEVSSFGDRRAAEGAAWSAPGVTHARDELAVIL